ncbi:hypothetical protein HMPREF9012_2026 [Bacteroidetes bacterium oral taxon 272 str. F0290]|nr:hypothetical protein HMPREF9012_2026 [Bacteroidetes bacterium oral taxon 272 str. F0290]
MKTNRINEIEQLQYQLNRYKTMRKGAVCQSLQMRLHKLLNQQAKVGCF